MSTMRTSERQIETSDGTMPGTSDGGRAAAVGTEKVSAAGAEHETRDRERETRRRMGAFFSLVSFFWGVRIWTESHALVGMIREVPAS